MSKMHNLHIALLAMAFAGCATARPPEPRIEVREVPVPVPVRCRPAITRPNLPDVDATAANPTADTFDLSKVYRAWFVMAKPYIAQLEAALKGCAG